MADAMRSLSVLRRMKAAIRNKEIERMKLLAEEEVIAVLHIKQRRDSIEQFRRGNRGELALKEGQEIRVIEEYLSRRPLRKRSGRPLRRQSGKPVLARSKIWTEC